ALGQVRRELVQVDLDDDYLGFVLGLARVLLPLVVGPAGRGHGEDEEGSDTQQTPPAGRSDHRSVLLRRLGGDRRRAWRRPLVGGCRNGSGPRVRGDTGVRGATTCPFPGVPSPRPPSFVRPSFP